MSEELSRLEEVESDAIFGHLNRSTGFHTVVGREKKTLTLLGETLGYGT